MKIYRGRHETVAIVTVDGLPLPKRLELRNHSPTGFQWGYAGSGPAQLALAIVCDVLNVPPRAKEPPMCFELAEGAAEPPVVRALRLYQSFKFDVVARWNGPTWEINSDQVMAILERAEEMKK